MEHIRINHRGLEVEQTLVKKGINIKDLAIRLNLFEEHLHVLFGDRFLDYDIINLIGNKIGHDFCEQFPQLQQELSLTGKKDSI